MSGNYPFDSRDAGELNVARQRVDYLLLQNALLHRAEQGRTLDLLAFALNDLTYAIVSLDADGWTSDADIYRQFAEELDFPPGGGTHLDALGDWLNDVCELGFGPGRAHLGIGVLILNFGAFQEREPTLARQFVETMEHVSRYGLLVNYPVIVVLHSTGALRPAQELRAIDYIVG